MDIFAGASMEILEPFDRISIGEHGILVWSSERPEAALHVPAGAEALIANCNFWRLPDEETP